MTWPTLDEAAAALGKSRRTLFRWQAEGRLLRIERDDGTAVYTLADGASDEDTGGDDADDMALNDVAMSSKTGPGDEPAARGPGRPPDRKLNADPATLRAVREAKARAVVHRLTGPAYISLIDLAGALDAIDEAVRAQVDAEALVSMTDADAGQAGWEGWRRLADAIVAALGDVNTMLERRVVDDARLAGLDRTLRRTERTWSAAREYDCRTTPGGPSTVAAVRRRAQRESHLFGAAAEALRRALVE